MNYSGEFIELTLSRTLLQNPPYYTLRVTKF